MATVRILNNIFSDELKTFSVEEGTSIESIIRNNVDENVYNGELVECYDLETGKTYYAPLEDNSETLNAIIQVNGKDAALSYEVKADDIVFVTITPASGGGGMDGFMNWMESGQTGDWNWWGALAGYLSGTGQGALTGWSMSGGNWVGLLVGAIIGGTAGFVAGGVVGGQMVNNWGKIQQGSGSDAYNGIDSEKLPDVRGATNQPLANNPFPFVLGKHLVTPFVAGSPYNLISGHHGDTNYIQVLYVIGYSPLRLTDFKLGEQFLAHNQRWAGNANLKNVFNGILSGTDSSASASSDLGDIVNVWKNNDIQLEILQQSQNPNVPVNYGYIYPYAKIQNNVNASILYIADGSLVEIDSGKKITYKGLGLKDGLRTNSIYFSEQFPKSVKVELDFPSGLYKTRSENEDGTSEVHYYKIPMWVAIQWRVYSDENDKADGEHEGALNIPTFNYSTGKYEKIDGKVKRGWNTFAYVNDLSVSTYTLENRYDDIDAHTGNTLRNEKPDEPPESSGSSSGGYNADPVAGHQTGGSSTSSGSSSDDPDEPWVPEHTEYSADINNGWIGGRAFNLQYFGGSDDDKEGISEFRCTAEVDFIEWANAALRASGDTEEQFIQKFKSYFFDETNSANLIEVRVVRLSPNYLDEIHSDEEKSAFKFFDILNWTTITSTVLDGDKLINENQFVQKRPLPEEDMRKLCLVALRAKTDNIDQLTNTLKSFSCVAESFAPYYDDNLKKWFPENVNKVQNYFRYDSENNSWTPITQNQFYYDRQHPEEGNKSISTRGGNNFLTQLNNVIDVPSHYDDRNRLCIPYDDTNPDGTYVEGCDGTMKYLNNNVASMFLLSGIGPHLGNDALGYSQNNYNLNGMGDFNMLALATWFKWAEDVTDGSTDAAGNIVHMKFAANAYLYQTKMLENVLASIAMAGRAVYTRDNSNRLTVIIDKPEQYPVALINQQNTFKSSYTVSFAELPSGLQLTFPDEEDGYEQNPFYCMADGEDARNPHKAIEPYGLEFVTNRHQMFSLGRYLLANRILNREVVTKQLGVEGASLSLGDLVLVSDDTMLIGTDTGGRITQLIENDDLIFGFVINNTFHYTGETEEYEEGGETKTRCIQGVTVMQPTKYKEATVVTLRLAKKGTTIQIGNKIYRARKGNTNTVLFDVPIAKNSNNQEGYDYYVYQPKVDNIVAFGIVGKITSKYRIIKIKPSADRKYDFTLMKYQDDLYNYGAQLPSFQNNMTVPDRSNENAFALTNNVTQEDLVRALAESAMLAQGKIDDTFGQTPPVPSSIIANAKENCIQVSCVVDNNKVNVVDHIVYEIKKADSSVASINGSYSTEYYFNRNIDGYPESTDLQLWQVRAKAVSVYFNEYGTRIESAWSSWVNISQTSLRDYGTWTPPIPTVTSLVPDENGITAKWACDLTKVYGTTRFEVTVYYNNTVLQTFNVFEFSGTYQFSRATDGFPEKNGTAGASGDTKILDNYCVKVRAHNITSSKTNDSITRSFSSAELALYKTWIPSQPRITPRVVNRSITLQLSHNGDSYGVVEYLVGVRSQKDPFDTFYVPDGDTNPYSRETAYKLYRDGVFVVGVIESPSQYTQTMPLESQNGNQAGLDVSAPNAEEEILTIPTAQSEEKILVIDTEGSAPIDTTYQFEVRAYNRTVESYCDEEYEKAHGVPFDHGYDYLTYHKVSVTASRVYAVALATSVRDILNGAIVSDKIANGAITETKIEDDSISTPLLKANAVRSDKMYTYNMVTLDHGAHVISGYAYTDDDTEMYRLVNGIITHNERPDERPYIDQIDDYIKSKSYAYWIGLDTNQPELYLGDHLVADKYLEAANYFHYYWENGGANLDIKLSNFIVTAISSTIRGFFNVKSKNIPSLTGANAFLRVNPELVDEMGDTEKGYYYNGAFYEDSSYQHIISPSEAQVYEDISTNPHKYYQYRSGIGYQQVTSTNAETMILKGDLLISTKNSNGQTGKLKVEGLIEAGALTIGGNSAFTGTLSVTGDSSFNGNVSVGQNQAGLTKTLTVNGALVTNGTLSVTGDTSLAKTYASKLNVNSDILVNYDGIDSGINVQIGNGTQAGGRNTRIYGNMNLVRSTALGNALDVNGYSKFHEDVTIGTESSGYQRNLYVNGSQQITTNLTVNGTTTLRSLSVSLISNGNNEVSVTYLRASGYVTGARMVIPTSRPSGAGVGDIWLEYQ